MASIFVEYVQKEEAPGYSEGPLNVKVKGHGYLDFTPKGIYGDRRVEELTTEDAAIELCNRFQRQGLFKIAKDLIATQDLTNIESFISGRISSLTERVESLEEQVAQLKKKPQNTRAKK